MTTYADQVYLQGLLNPPPDFVSRGVFPAALAAAGLLHLALVLGIDIAPPAVEPPPESTLEVLILKETGQPTQQPLPDAPLSQLSRAGESTLGDSAASAHGDERLPRAEESQPAAESPETSAYSTQAPDTSAVPPPDRPSETQAGASRAAPVLAPVRETPAVLSARTSSKLDPVPVIEPPRATPPRVEAGQILASRGLEIARLTSNLEARSEAYAKRVRRKSISASTRELKYASYLDAWARKVERIGNINYPRAAKEQRIYGSLILHVSIRSDGSLERIRVVKSSGYDLLDDAAVQIVELSAPFSPFPADIAAETDVLDIIRTWQFMRGNVLGWER